VPEKPYPYLVKLNREQRREADRRRRERGGRTSKELQPVQQGPEHKGRIGSRTTPTPERLRAGDCVDCGCEERHHVRTTLPGVDPTNLSARKSICTRCLRFTIPGMEHKFKAAGNVDPEIRRVERKQASQAPQRSPEHQAELDALHKRDREIAKAQGIPYGLDEVLTAAGSSESQ
jgi:hypothetical protein